MIRCLFPAGSERGNALAHYVNRASGRWSMCWSINQAARGRSSARQTDAIKNRSGCQDPDHFTLRRRSRPEKGLRDLRGVAHEHAPRCTHFTLDYLHPSILSDVRRLGHATP